MIKIKQATSKGYILCVEGGVADLSYPGSKTRRGRVQGGGQISPTLTCMGGLYRLEPEDKRLRIRRLTPRECAALMGLSYEDDDKIKAMSISDTQRYRCYGNGIITNCVKLIFEHLFQAQYDQDYQCSDESNIKYINSERERSQPEECILHRCQLLERNNSRSISPEEEKTACCIRVGNASSKGSQAGFVFHPDGIFQTVCACTHGYAIGNILEDKRNE